MEEKKTIRRTLKFIPVFLGTLITYTVGQVINGIFILFALIFSLLGMKTVVKFLARVWSNLLFLMLGKKVDIKGRENLDKNKGYIYLVNHASFLDIPALMLVNPDIAWVGKDSYTKIPVFGKLIKMMGFIPIKLDDPEKIMDSFLGAIEAAQKNTSIGFFPEGTRTLDGTIKKFKKGFVYILRNCNLDVLPVTFNGFFDLKPKNSFLVNPDAKLEIIIHKPVENSILKAQSDSTILSAMRDIINRSYIHRIPQVTQKQATNPT